MSETDYQFATNITTIEHAPLLLKLKHFFWLIIGAAFVYGVLWVIGGLFSLGWLTYVNYVLTGLLVLAAFFVGITAKTAKCPYCNADLGKGDFDVVNSDDENAKLECNYCHQWLISNQGEVRSFTFEDAKGRSHFEAPVLKDGIWPDCCIVCGAEATRVGEVKKKKMNWGALLVGSISVSSGSIKNIPYCDEHFGQVELTIKDDYLRLKFPEYEQLLRYLAVNGQGKKPIKCK